MKKDIEFEEENVRRNSSKNEERVVKVEKKKSSHVIAWTIGICLFLSVIFVGSTLVLWKTGKLGAIKRWLKNELTQTETVEIKHTDTVTVKSDGVYITDVSEVVDEVMPSIVAITSKTVISSGNYGPSIFGFGGGSYTTEGAGSGVIVSENDNEIFILTNYHVVENTTELSVQFINDKSYDATIKGVSKSKDIAIVSVSKKEMDSETLKSVKIATLGNSNELKVGNGIIAIGNALGYGQSVTTGVVSALNREVTTDSYSQEMIQIDAAINGGNSGGALLNSKGEVVGINAVKYSNRTSGSASIEGMGFAIPISDVEDIIEELIKGKNDDGAVVLGIEGGMTSSLGINNNLPDGFYVTAIESGSNAANSELEIGNIITEVDNNKVTSVETIRKALNKKKKGDTIKLKVKYVSRNEYKEKEITIKLN